MNLGTIDLAKEKDQQRIKVILGDFEAQLKALKDESCTPIEQEIIDTMMGGMPVYMYLLSHKNENKSIGELLLLPENRADLLEIITKSLPPKDMSLQEILKTTVMEYPAKKSDEQRIMQLFEKIVKILQEVSQIIIITLLHICNQLDGICNQVKK